MPLFLEDAAKAKNNIMASQQKEIAKLYDNWANEVADRAKYYSHKTNASAPLSERYYKELYNQMKATSKAVSDEVAGIIKSNMYAIADSVVADNVKWLESFGFSSDGLNAAFSYVPNDVVQMLITGQVYKGGWNLSQRIWSDNQQTQKDIYQIVASGLAQNKSVYNIAKDLESYVRPSAKKNWNPILAMTNTKTGKVEHKRIYKNQVDYNAQRLARTLAQHTYQQSLIATTKNNPFIIDYIWHSNGSRVCDLCKARDGAHYKKDELPMDHPNGMCVIEPTVADNITDQLADWFNSPDGTYPDIDEFAKNFGYEAKPAKSAADFVNKYGTSTKTPNAWYNSLNQIQKAEAKMLKEQSGLKWNDWYEKNIYAGSKTSTAVSTAAKAIKNTANKILDVTNWIPKFKNQNESHMLDLEQESMKLLGKAGQAGIKMYSGSAYSTMNSYLRYLQQGYSEKEAAKMSNISPSKLKAVNDAMKGLSKTKLTEDLLLRRGTDLGDLAGAFMSGDFQSNRSSLYGKTASELNDMFSGAVGKYGSFTSTSSLWDRGFSGNVEIIMYAPKGISASSIMSISQYGTSEGETLLNANTTVKCLKIEESDGHKNSTIRVYMEIIPDE